MRYGLVLLTLAALICGCPSGSDTVTEDKLIIFHNGTGPMCLDALSWLESIRSQYPELVAEEHLSFDPASIALLQQMRTEYGESQGVSTSFGYLPLIFYRGQAFSGFNDQVKESLAGLLASAAQSSL